MVRFRGKDVIKLIYCCIITLPQLNCSILKIDKFLKPYNTTPADPLAMCAKKNCIWAFF